MITAEVRNVVYSPEMTDAEIKKLLHEIGRNITDKINEHPPVPPLESHKLTFPQWIGVIVSVFAIVGGLLTALNYVVTSAITAALVQPGKDLATITEQGKELRKDVDRLLDQRAKNTLQAPLGGTASKEDALEIRDAAEWAAKRKIQIDPSVLKRVSNFVMKRGDPDGWNANIALLNLKSFTNTTIDYARQHVVRKIEAGLGTTFDSPPADSNEWVELDNANFWLDWKPGEDGYHSKTPGLPFANLILKNSIVRYTGGKVTLVNVFFDNCQFLITNNSNGVRLAEAILSGSYTSFTAD